MRYALRERMLTLRDEYAVEDEQGRPVWTIRGRLLAWGKQLTMADAQGREAARIRQRMLCLMPRFEVERDGAPTALVRKRWAWFKDRFTVEIEGAEVYDVEGNFLGRDYAFTRDGRVAATVSRKLFSLSDHYGLETEPGEDDLLIVASVVVIDLARQSADASAPGS